jgi:hypothetical protein
MEQIIGSQTGAIQGQGIKNRQSKVAKEDGQFMRIFKDI